MNPPSTAPTSVGTRDVAVIKARGANVVVEILSATASSGGIILPTKHEERVRTGLVVAVGDGILALSGDRVPINLRVGDVVALRPGRGLPVVLGGRPYLVLDQAEIPVVFTTPDGGTLSDHDAVDPSVRRRPASAVDKSGSVDDGEPKTESLDARCEHPVDRMRDEQPTGLDLPANAGESDD